MSNTFENLFGSLDTLFGVEKLLRGGVKVGECLVAVPDSQGERFETFVSGLGGLGPLLWLERKVEIFEPLGIVGPSDRGGEFVTELTLGFDRFEDRFFALGQLPESS